MTLIHSSSKQALKQNMRTLNSEIGRSPHIQSRAQAVAIGLETQRRAKNKAYGGGIRGYDDGGDVLPLDPATEAQAAREAASARLARGVIPTDGRQEGALTESIPDLIPGRAAVRDISSGNYGQGALDVASDLVPFSKFVPAPVRRAVLSGGILGAGALMPVNSDQARAEDLTWMTPQQKSTYGSIRGRDNPETRMLRGKFVQEQLALAQARQDKIKEQEAAVERAKQESAIQSAAEERKLAAMRADEGARVEQERQARLQAEHDAAAELERRSKLPFRERHPEAAMGIQGAMLGLSAAVPFGQTLATSKNWSNIANRAEQAMAAGNKPASKLAIDQLRKYGKPSWGEKAAVLNSPLMPLEGGTVIPNAWDYYSLGVDESNPNWQAAQRELNPMGPKFWENAGIGLVEGVPLSLLGSKAAGLVARPPKEQAAGLIKSFEERKSWPRTQKQSTAPAKQESAPVAKKVQTRKKADPSQSQGGSIQTRAGGGGIAGGFDQAFGDLFSNVPKGIPQPQQSTQGGYGNNPLSAMFGGMTGGNGGIFSGLENRMESNPTLQMMQQKFQQAMASRPELSPSSPIMTGITNGVSRLAPVPQGSGVVATPPIQQGTPMQGGNNMMQPVISPVAARNRAEGGGFDMTKGPHMNTGWQTRQEARGMMHTGPIYSSVPGRTDAHSTRVPSGSYILPADIIAGRGQGNTLAGMKSYMQLFKTGPYGTSMPHLGHGAGIPRGPRLQKVAHSGGGKGGDDNIGSPVDVNLAGGELCIPPHALMETVHPDLDTAHAIMDRFVISERKKQIAELRKLPGPAKD